MSQNSTSVRSCTVSCCGGGAGNWGTSPSIKVKWRPPFLNSLGTSPRSGTVRGRLPSRKLREIPHPGKTRVNFKSIIFSIPGPPLPKIWNFIQSGGTRIFAASRYQKIPSPPSALENFTTRNWSCVTWFHIQIKYMVLEAES